MDNAIKNENRLTKMEERLKNIEDKIDKLPKELMDLFRLEAREMKNEAIREARLEDEKVFVKRSDVEFLEKIVCDVVSKQVGKWFITKVVISTAVIVAVIQYIISLYK
jgi:hypothetical protein